MTTPKSQSSPKSQKKSKTHGQRQQEQSQRSPKSQVTTKKPRQIPFKDRPASTPSSPSTPTIKSPRKPKTAPSDNPGQLASVEEVHETIAVTVVNVTSAGASIPTAVTELAARSPAGQVLVGNVSSSASSIPNEEQQLVPFDMNNKRATEENASAVAANVPKDPTLVRTGKTQRTKKQRERDADENNTSDSSSTDSSSTDNKSSSITTKRKRNDKDAGQNEADINDSSSTDSQSDSSNDRPTPVKKQSGIDRLQRGRKIKASSPAGRKYPTRTCFDLLFDFV